MGKVITDAMRAEQAVAKERAAFEETVFAQRFLSSIQPVKPGSFGAVGMPLGMPVGCPDKKTFLRRGLVTPRAYVDPIIDAMWWAWQARAKRDVNDDIPF